MVGTGTAIVDDSNTITVRTMTGIAMGASTIGGVTGGMTESMTESMTGIVTDLRFQAVLFSIKYQHRLKPVPLGILQRWHSAALPQMMS